MNLRDIKIISNYVERVIKRDKKQLNYEDWKYIGKDIKTNKPEFSPVIAKRVVMSNLELANNKIIDALTRNGIDIDKPLSIYNEAYEIAKTKENSKDLITIADRYVDLLDMKPKNQQQTQQTEQISFTKMLDSGEKAKITAKREIKSVENGEKIRVNTITDVENGEKTDNSNTDNATEVI